MKFTTAKSLVASARGDVAYAQKRATHMAKNQVALRVTLEFIEAVTKRFDESPISASTWIGCNTWSTDPDPVVIMQTYRATVDSMKEGLVPQLLKVLMDAGFDVEKTTDYPDQGHREFKLVRPRDADGKKVRVEIEFNARVSGSAEATCRKVQIGTEVKEIPIYKLECPEATAEEIAATLV